MLKSNNIRAQMRELQNEIHEIVKLATAEDRELTDSEKAIVDRIQGIGDEPGEIHALQDDLERAVRFESRLSDIASSLDFGGSNGNGSNGKGSIMSNAHGQKVTVLNRGESYASTIKDASSTVPYAMGEMIRAAVTGPNHNTPEPIRAAMSEGNDSRGGMLVPFRLMPGVVDLARANSAVMDAGAQMVIMEGPQLTMATVEEDPTFDVHPELQTIALSDIKFGARNLVAVTIASRMKASRELVEDAPNFVSEVEQVLAASLGAQLDYYAINGHTNTKPMGLLQNPDINSTGSIGAIDWTDIATAVTTTRTANYEPNAAIMAPSIHDALFNIETGDGTNSARGWLDAPPSIRDKQFLHTTNCPTANIIVGQFSNLKWGLRQGALIEVSTEADDAFSTHSVYIKITWRGDFLVTRPAAFEILAGVTAS